MQREKLAIRLPDDPGPNPYDSKTEPQKPLFIRWEFIVTVVLFGIALTWVRFPEAFARVWDTYF